VILASTGNSTVKRIRALRERKAREDTGLFFVEGIRPVVDAVESGSSIETCVVAPGLLTSRFALDVVQRLRDRGISILELSPAAFATLSIRDGPQGLGAVVRQCWTHLPEQDPAGSFCWVALDGVQDPGNLGTILRTSDATGATGVILLGQGTDPFEPGAVRASMGAIFWQQLVRSSFADLDAWRRNHGWYLLGTSDAAATDYQEARYQVPLILLMGSERQGLSREQQALCDLVVRIPMVGKSDSLNLAVATGVMLYEIFTQQRGTPPETRRFDFDRNPF
jgi:TrmH family RNA methyltransferase